MPTGDPVCFPYRIDDLYYTVTMRDPTRERDATAAVRALIDAGWTAAEAFSVVRLDTQPARRLDGAVLCAEGGSP